MFGNMKLFLELNSISTRLHWSTLDINFVFPHTHVLFSTYCLEYFNEDSQSPADITTKDGLE